MITEESIQIIKDNQQASVHAKTLVEPQLRLIYSNNWFNMWVPRLFGGLELELKDGLDLLEELAYWDGSFAWTVTLCAGANMFAGYLNKDLAEEVFSNSKVCFGGSGRVGGKAVWDGTHYTLTGFWRFATGAPHLSHFTLNSLIYDGDQPRVDSEGNPVFFSFLVPRDHVLIHYDWDSFGLSSTASHSFSLENVRLDAKHAFQINPDHRVQEVTLYNIPFLPFAELTLLVNYMGMYRRYLDLVEKFFFERSKDEKWLLNYGNTYFKKVDKLRLTFVSDKRKIDELAVLLWDVSAQNLPIEKVLLDDIASTARKIVKMIREEVVDLFPLVGIAASQNGHEVNTVFRNIFTATQHSLLNIERI